MRTETTTSNNQGLSVGRRLKGRAALGELGFAANRRWLEVKLLDLDCMVGVGTLQRWQQAAVVEDQLASAGAFSGRGCSSGCKAGVLGTDDCGLSLRRGSVLTKRRLPPAG